MCSTPARWRRLVSLAATALNLLGAMAARLGEWLLRGCCLEDRDPNLTATVLQTGRCKLGKPPSRLRQRCAVRRAPRREFEHECYAVGMTLAVLLSFLLSPVCDGLERHWLGRIPPFW